MPGTAKVRGSNLIRTSFFFEMGNYVSKKLSAYCLPAYVLSA